MRPDTPIRWGDGGRRFRTYSFSVSLGLAVLLVVGCDISPTETNVSTLPMQPSISTTPASSSTAPLERSTTTATAPTPTMPDASAAVITAWTNYWLAWAEVRSSENPSRVPLEAVASSAVVDSAMSLLEQERNSGRQPGPTTIITHTVVTGATTSKAMVEDCVLLEPSFTDAVGVWYRAELNAAGDGWIVTALEIPRLQGCVPASLANGAIAVYEAFYEGWTEFWDPADPGHPLVGDLLTGEQLEVTVGLLEAHRQRGVALRGRPTTHPEVVELRSLTELVILDCHEPASDYGVYDIATGERMDDEAPVAEGQRNLRSAVMVFVDGKWKISDLQGQIGSQCQIAPTERGLPVI